MGPWEKCHKARGGKVSFKVKVAVSGTSKVRTKKVPLRLHSHGEGRKQIGLGLAETDHINIGGTCLAQGPGDEYPPISTNKRPSVLLDPEQF